MVGFAARDWSEPEARLMAAMESSPRSALGGPVVWARQNRHLLRLILAGLVGLLVFPLVFDALAPHDFLLAGKFSLLDLVWLVLALISVVVLLAERTTVGVELRAATTRALSGVAVAGGGATSPAVDLPDTGNRLAQGLFNLVVLLVVQAILRRPLVGLLSGQVAAALVDGVFVGVVVLAALGLFWRLYRVSTPLLRQLVWLGLDRLVPTAGFAGGPAPAEDRTRVATRATHRAPSAAAAAPAASAAATVPAAAEPGSDLPTVAAAAAQPTVLEGAATVVAPTATVVAEGAAAPAGAPALPAGALATVDEAGADGATRVAEVEATIEGKVDGR
jgi:hypothetical protein